MSATGVGNIVYVVGYLQGSTDTLSSVTDNASGGANTYVVQTAVDSPSERIVTAYGFQVRGGATTITLTYSGTNNLKRDFCDEYSGFSSSLTNARAFDASTTGSGTGTSATVSTLTTARTGNLIIAAAIGTNLSAGTNYTLYGSPTAGGSKSEYRLSSAASETAPFSLNSSDWAERATSFNSGLAITIIETPTMGASVEGMAKGRIITEVSGAPVDSGRMRQAPAAATKHTSTWSNTSKT